MTPQESFVGQVRPGTGTGLGTTFWSADSTGVVVYAPTRLKQDSYIFNETETVNVLVLAATVDMPVFIPVRGVWVLDGVTSVRRVVGSDGSAVTADIMACASAVAPASGVTQLLAADSINLKSPAADVILGYSLAATMTEVGPGSYFGLNVTGTLTAVVALITLAFKRLR